MLLFEEEEEEEVAVVRSKEIFVFANSILIISRLEKKASSLEVNSTYIL